MSGELSAKNAIAAIRVSSVKQGTEGDSPDAQREQMEQFAKSRDLTIKKFFVFLESASKAQQPMQEAIDYCKDPKNNIQLFIIKSIDRFTRGGSYSYDYLKLQLDGCNVGLVDIYGVIGSQRVNTLEHLGVEYKWSTYSPTKKAEILEAERAKDEIRDIMSRMIGAQIRYARMGYWVRRPLYGFDNEHIETSDGKRCILRPNTEEAPYVKKIFELQAQGTMDDDQIIEEMNRLGYKTRVRLVRDKDDRSRIIERIGGEPLSLKVLWSILENPVYAGINPEKWTQGQPVKCKFDGLVSIELFNRANRGKTVISEVDGKLTIHRRQPPEHLPKKGVKNAEFPYKRVIMCPKCDKPLLGSASRGRHGKYFPAYHCDQRGHKFRVKKRDFDQTVVEFVQGIQIAPKFVEMLSSAVLTEWEERQAMLRTDELHIDAKIKELRTQIQLAVDKIKFLSSDIAIKYIEEEIVKLEAEISGLMIEKEKQAAKEPPNVNKVLALVRYFLEHLDYLLLQQRDPVIRAKFFGLLFNRLPNYEALISGTPDFVPVIELNQLFQQRKLIPSRLMVGDEGFEPPTPSV
jgi:site-specific DNA recombinase